MEYASNGELTKRVEEASFLQMAYWSKLLERLVGGWEGKLAIALKWGQMARP
jgi:hypothetical protein